MNSWFRTIALLSLVAGTVLACGGDNGSEPQTFPSSDVNNQVVLDQGALPDEVVIEDFVSVQDTQPAPQEEVTDSQDLASAPQDESSTPVSDTGGGEDIAPLVDEGSDGEIPPVLTLPPGLVGEPAPNNDPITEELLAAVVDETGTPVNLDDVLGHWTVLWFYPMANTSG